MGSINGKRSISKIKKILSISIILLILLPLCTILIRISKATEDDDEYCSFDVNWSNGTKELTANSGTSVSAQFDLDLNTVQTGFEHLEISIDTSGNVKIINPNDANVEAVSSNRLIFKDNVKAGTNLTSSINFTFYESTDLKDYEESIHVTLTGEYIDPQTNEYVQINIEKTLKVFVICPESKAYYYYSNINLEKDSVGATGKRSIIGETVEGEKRVIGWKASGVEASYDVWLSSGKYTKNATLDITINRTSERNNKPMESGYTVDFGGLKRDFGEPQKIENDNGSVTFRFCISKDCKEFNEGFNVKEKEYNITVNYTIPDTENSLTQTEQDEYLKSDGVETKIYFDAEIKGTGWDVVYTKKDGCTTKEVDRSNNVKSVQKVGILSYTPGYHSWASVNYYKTNTTNLTKNELEALSNGEDIDLGFRTSIYYIIDRDTDEQTGSVVHKGLDITYLGDDKSIKKVAVGESMFLKSITGTDGMTLIENGKSHDLSNPYTVEDGSKISSYSVKLDDFLRKRYSGYNVVYTLSGAKLKELGLSETEIMNISSISQKTTTSGNEWLKGENEAYYYFTDSEVYLKSYMELDIGDSNDNINRYGEKQEHVINLLTYKNKNVFRDTNVKVKNVNPTIYIKFPEAYKYTVKEIKLSDNVKGKMYVSSYYMENGFLIINCKGTYISESEYNKMEIQVKTERELIDINPSTNQYVEAWLFTDNENYVDATYCNINQDNIFAQYMKDSFTIEKSSGILIRTAIYKNGVMNIPDGHSASSKENPIKYKNNEIVTYRTKVNAKGQTINNISIINKLPLQGNKNINGTLDLGSNISLINLQNIKVYVNNIVQTSGYTILYNTDENIDFQELTEDTDLSTIKTIKIVMANDFMLYGDKELIIEYQMTMPTLEENENNLAGSISAIEYTDDQNMSRILESSASYVTNGNPNGTIKLKKVFEGIEEGAPKGISLEGIRFRFVNVETNSVLVLEGQNEEGIFETDQKGEINIENVPEGTYKILEESEFENYNGINYTEVTIKNGKSYPETVEVKNRLKLGTLNIYKRWEETKESQGEVTLKVERTDNKEFSAIATVDEKTGIATFVGLPYGEYKITETSRHIWMAWKGCNSQRK